MKQIGFYSLVRYVDDVDRGETLNVGALLEIEGRTFKKFVERSQLNSMNDAVHRFDSLITEVLDRGDWQDPEDEAPDEGGSFVLRALARRRFPHFAITEPRQVVIDDEPEVVLERLSHRLVEEAAVSAWR